MSFSTISWILQLIVCFVYFNGITGICETDYNETPSLPLCGQGVLSVRPGQAIYLDTSGAPDFTKVECKFDISLSSAGSVTISSKVNIQSIFYNLNCDVHLKLGLGWSNVPCFGGTISYNLDTSTYKATYIKNTSLISDWYACIAITSEDSSISLTVKSYPYRQISSQEHEPSTTLWPVDDLSIPGQSTMAVESRGNNVNMSLGNKVGPIVGGVIGCCGLVALIVSVACFIIRRKNGQQSTGKGENAYYLTPIENKNNNEQRAFPKYDNNVRNKRAEISLPNRTQSSIQDKEDIHTYEYIDEKYVRVAKVEPMVRTPLLTHQPAVSEPELTLEQTDLEPDLPTHSTVLEPLLNPLPRMQDPVIPSQPKVRKPLLPPKPTVHNPKPQPREDAEGYLQPASKCQAPYSCLAYDKDKSNQEHQYHALQTYEETEETAVHEYL